MLMSQTYGQGQQSVVLLHGFLGAGRNLASLARFLVAEHPDLRVIVPDLPGHGQSPPMSAHSDLDAIAQSILELVEQNCQGPVDLFGHSLGGRIALAALGRAPTTFRRVAMLDISPSAVGILGGGLQQVLECLMQAPATAQDRRQMRQFFIDAGVSQALSDWIVMSGYMHDGCFQWRIDRQRLRDFHQRTSQTDLWPIVEGWAKLPTNTRPALMLARGSASNYVNDVDFARLQKLGCQTKTLLGAGHFVHVDAKEELAKWLL